MPKITIIGTRHEKYGMCSSDALCQIMAKLNPDVIFEEIPPTYFDKYYIEKSKSNLETRAITRFLLGKQTPHIPVDSDDLPTEEFFQNYYEGLRKIEKLNNRFGWDYCQLVDQNKQNTFIYGFDYLNSNHCETIVTQTNAAIEQGLQFIKEQKLSDNWYLWKTIHEQRENSMLGNIVNYCNVHRVDTAVFTVGAAHRSSLRRKTDPSISFAQEIDWKFYNDPQKQNYR